MTVPNEAFLQRPTSNGSHRNFRILIVDDEVNFRLLLRKRLEVKGYECLEADNGVGARIQLMESHVDLLITDYQMPVVNGLQLIEWLKQKRPDLPVVLLTGRDHETLQIEAKKLGVHAILGKPYQPEELDCMVSKALRKADTSNGSQN